MMETTWENDAIRETDVVWGGGLFWCVASVNLKGIAALSPAVIFFKFVLIS